MTRLGMLAGAALSATAGAIVGAAGGSYARGRGFQTNYAYGLDDVLGAIAGGALFAALATPTPPVVVQQLPPPRFP